MFRSSDKLIAGKVFFFVLWNVVLLQLFMCMSNVVSTWCKRFFLPSNLLNFFSLLPFVDLKKKLFDLCRAIDNLHV